MTPGGMVGTQMVATPVGTQAVGSVAPVLTYGAGGYPMAMQGSSSMGVGALPVAGGLLKAGSITDDVFNMVDRNNDGVISRSEFRGALKGNVISATPNTRLAIGQ